MHIFLLLFFGNMWMRKGHAFYYVLLCSNMFLFSNFVILCVYLFMYVFIFLSSVHDVSLEIHHFLYCNFRSSLYVLFISFKSLDISISFFHKFPVVVISRCFFPFFRFVSMFTALFYFDPYRITYFFSSIFLYWHDT